MSEIWPIHQNKHSYQWSRSCYSGQSRHSIYGIVVHLRHTIKLRKANQSAKVKRRIALAWTSFGILHIIINRNFRDLNRKVYKICVYPVTIYGLEIITLIQNHVEQLRVNESVTKRATLRDKITNIGQKTEITNIFLMNF